MAIQIFESWKGPALTRGMLDEGWRAVRTFSAVGAGGNKSAALNALAAQFAVAGGSAHPDNARLICGDVTCGDGFNLLPLTANYTIPTLGQFDPDPLKAKTRWRWTPGTEVEVTDADIFDNPIGNSTGIPFDQNGQRFNGLMDLTATRNEPFYDAELALLIHNTTNPRPFTVRTRGTGTKVVAPGQAFLTAMCLETEVTTESLYATVTYNFRFKRGRLIPGEDEYDSFFLVRLDQGDAGYMRLTDGTVGVGLFCNNDGMLIGNTLLDGLGRPIDPDIQVLSLTPDGVPTIGAPQAVNTIPDDVKILDFGDRVYLAYRQYEQYDVLNLNL